jgi:hypothetical protein
MSECLPDMPRYIRQTPAGGWEGANHQNGPWRPITAPQSGLPWPVPSVAEQSSAPQPAAADRLALAVCPHRCHPSQICGLCRRDSANHCRELALILRERHGGSSQVADWLDGVGAHP